jgi:hypothetical protein
MDAPETIKESLIFNDELIVDAEFKIDAPETIKESLTYKDPLFVVLFKIVLELSANVKLVKIVVLPNKIDVLLILIGDGIDDKPLILKVTKVVIPCELIIII